MAPIYIYIRVRNVSLLFNGYYSFSLKPHRKEGKEVVFWIQIGMGQWHTIQTQTKPHTFPVQTQSWFRYLPTITQKLELSTSTFYLLNIVCESGNFKAQSCYMYKVILKKMLEIQLFRKIFKIFVDAACYKYHSHNLKSTPVYMSKICVPTSWIVIAK